MIPSALNVDLVVVIALVLVLKVDLSVLSSVHVVLSVIRLFNTDKTSHSSVEENGLNHNGYGYENGSVESL